MKAPWRPYVYLWSTRSPFLDCISDLKCKWLLHECIQASTNLLRHWFDFVRLLTNCTSHTFLFLCLSVGSARQLVPLTDYIYVTYCVSFSMQIQYELQCHNVRGAESLSVTVKVASQSCYEMIYCDILKESFFHSCPFRDGDISCNKSREGRLYFKHIR